AKGPGLGGCPKLRGSAAAQAVARSSRCSERGSPLPRSLGRASPAPVCGPAPLCASTIGRLPFDPPACRKINHLRGVSANSGQILQYTPEQIDVFSLCPRILAPMLNGVQL